MRTQNWAKGAVVLLVLASSLFAQTDENRATQATSVSGPSWITHLGRSFDETSMGKTGRLGPPSAMPRMEFARWQTGLASGDANDVVTLHGSDLYRMNCRGCHGEEGLGSPPEINSVINPVRATSSEAVMERMKAAGMEMSRADAAKLAAQSKGMLLDRLHHGGQDMPAFPHLRDAEVISLIAYLRQLAGVRGAEGEQVTVREPRVQVGEHVVKSTCHICHSAAGPNPSPQQLYQGAIPPLNTLALRTSRAEFIRKVTHGAPVLMGTPPELFRGRMPVFYYLSEDEVADAYLYLTHYPPYRWAILDAHSGLASTAVQPDPVELEPQVDSAASSEEVGRAAVRSMSTEPYTKFPVLMVLVGFVAFALMGAGFGFTVRELQRLSARIGIRNRAVRTNLENAVVAQERLRQASERASRELVA